MAVYFSSIKDAFTKTMIELFRLSFKLQSTDVSKVHISTTLQYADFLTKPDIFIADALACGTNYMDLLVWIVAINEKMLGDPRTTVYGGSKKESCCIEFVKLISFVGLNLLTSDQWAGTQKEQVYPKLLLVTYPGVKEYLENMATSKVTVDELPKEWARGFIFEDLPARWQNRLSLGLAGSRALRCLTLLRGKYPDDPKLLKLVTMFPQATFAFHQGMRDSKYPSQMLAKLPMLMK